MECVAAEIAVVMKAAHATIGRLLVLAAVFLVAAPQLERCLHQKPFSRLKP